MLRNSDRFATADCRRLRLGQRLRLPLARLDRAACSLLNPLYRHPWEIVGFGGHRLRHCVHLRRVADGAQRTVAQHYLAFHLEHS